MNGAAASRRRRAKGDRDTLAIRRLPRDKVRPRHAVRRQTIGCPISAAFTIPACVLACGVCLLDDGMVLAAVAAALVMMLLALGATHLMAAAERFRR